MGKAAPAISVITIVKNNEELLPRAVDSVLAQSFADFEHIIVNDGSTDGTKAIIDAYAEKDQRVKPKHLFQNVGRGMARNAGMDTARGKYIFFLGACRGINNQGFL
jgi:glycosyltransferase involved in cell wall biosynthesis